MSAVYVHNITIDSGTDYEQEYDMFEVGGKVVDLANHTARAQIRKHRGSSTTVNFTVGFPDRFNGKIKLSIPSYVTSRLKPGRYLYDILFTKPGGTNEVILEGSVRVRAGYSTGCFGGAKPGSAQRICIAVIDEASSLNDSSTKWAQFRSTYPGRTFYLLQPDGSGFGTIVNNTNYSRMKCPGQFLNETTVNTGRLISENGD
jgi:hypothetical protein